MKTYARIVNNTLVELFATDGDMAEMFHPELVWADITNTVPTPNIHWIANFGTLGWVFALPEITPPENALKTLAKKWLTGISRQS